MVRWLVAGIGDITTKRVIPAILAEPRSVLHGLVTRDLSKAAAWPSARAWTRFEEAIADPAIDAVYVATPVALHAPQTIAALNAGKHVLCEKPVSTGFGEAVAMRDAARRTGRVLGIAYYRRLYPKLIRARQLLGAGVIGRPVLAEATCHYWFNDEDGRRGWLMDPEMAGGGPLFDIASHRIDAFNFLFGEPRRANGMRSSIVHGRPVEDNASVLVEYANGVRGIIDVRWHSRVERDGFRIVGTAGEMELSPLNGPAITWPGGSDQLPRHDNLHYPCVEDFVSAVLNGVPPAAPIDDAIQTDWVTWQVLEGGGRDIIRYHGSSGKSS